MILRYDARQSCLVSTKGHPFDRAAFFEMFDAMKGLAWTHVEQPATLALMTPEAAAPFGTLVFYDVPGLQFRTPDPPDLIAPPDAFRQGFRALLAAGKPMVFLHHAMAGWPLWDAYAEAVGARFFYQPGSYKGRAYPDSGYVFPVTYRAVPRHPDHPVLSGLEDGFELTDELYLFEMLEDVVPLLAADYAFCEENFYSAANALNARMWTRDGWSHPPGTPLIAWARAAGNAPTVTIQCGNDAATFANPAFRRLLRNAIDWVASPQAAAWARGH